MSNNRLAPFKKIIKPIMQQLANEMSSVFMPMPEATCACGKPIVFLHPSKTFVCTRCGNKYRLNVEIKKIGK